MPRDVTIVEVCAIVGYVMLVVGCAMISPAMAMIVGGGLLLLLAVVAALLTRG